MLVWLFTRTSISPCEREVRYGDRRRGVEICRASFDHTGDQRDLAWAAKGHMYLGEIDQADKLARRLLTGSLSGEGHGILSYVALRRGLHDEARMHALIALAIHSLAGDLRGRASDTYLLSLAALAAGDFRAALAAADEALGLARQLHDTHTEVVVASARADALRRMGDTRGATDTMATAIERATEPCDRAWARLKSGLCRMESGQDGLAMVDLTAAALANLDCKSQDVATSVSLNEAWLLRWTDPSGALSRLDELAKSQGEQLETLLLRAYLAADRGELAAAEHYLTEAAGHVPLDADWPWVIERASAELSELRGEPSGDLSAELHYRRAVAMVAALRGNARARLAYFVSSHRSPYDGLIALLAREGRWRDALAVMLQLDASDMLRATANEALFHDHVPLSAVLLATKATEASQPTVEEVLSAWRSRDLVIVIAPSQRRIGPGRERAYRLRINDGQVVGEDVGDATAARRWADRLFADPGDRDAARALGRIIVPPGPAEATLDVLAIGPLGKVPLMALRNDDGTLLIAKRPLARVLALGATIPESRGGGPPVIIANPTGDLADAAREGVMVAGALGPGAQVFGSGAHSPATRSRLWAARSAELLHVAGHVSTLGRWRALHLADGDVGPTEIVEQHLAPRIAVLAGCGSAAALDEEGWGSIAAALLQSGTAVVIATDRSVGDAASRSLMSDFYAQPDWRADPARALARVQQALDARAARSTDEATRPRLWAAFSVLRRPPVIPEDGR